MDELLSLIPLVDKSLIFAGRPIAVTADDAEKVRSGVLTENAVEYFICECALASTVRGVPCTVFPATFYGQVVDNRPKPVVSGFPEFVQKSLGLCDYPRLQTQHLLSVFDNKFTLIPVNLCDHWILVVVYSGPLNVSSTRPHSCLFLFDSMEGLLRDTQTSVLAVDIRAFLNCVWFFEMHKGREQALREFNEHTCPMVSMNVPQQIDVADGGVHVIQAARAIIAKLPEFYGHCKAHEGNMMACRDFFVRKIVVGDDVRVQMLRMLVASGRKRTKRTIVDM